MPALELQEGRPCSLHAYGPDTDDTTIDGLEEIGNWQGPDIERALALTGPEQGLLRDGRAAQDVLPNNCSTEHLDTIDRWASWTVIAPAVLGTFGSGAQGPATLPPSSWDPATLSVVPAVKLLVSSPQWKGPIWIDCDRTIVLPSTRLCIRIMAPPGWVDAGAFRPGDGPVFEEAWNAWLTVKVCRAACCPTGLPILTESFELEPDGTRRITRRRGARRIWFSSQATPQVWNLIRGNTTVGSAIVPANAIDSLELAPGITAIELQPLPVLRDVTVTWEVQP